MSAKIALLASALGLVAASAPAAKATVVYEVFNPTAKFVFFVYDSPGFITTDTIVPASSLAYNNPIHPATSIDFIMDSPVKPGFANVQITIEPDPPVPPVQPKYIPPADLAQYGTYQFAPGSYGYPNSYLLVAAPEPSAMAVFGAGLIGLLGLARRCRGNP